MFRDKEEELQRLSRQLREETEEPEEWEEEEETVPDVDDLLEDDTHINDMTDGVYRNASNGYGQNLRNFASGYKAYNGDRTDVDLQELSEEIRMEDEEEEKSLTGLVVTAFVLATAVVGVLIYWLIRGGIF